MESPSRLMPCIAYWRVIDLFLHQQGLDTTTPGGKAMFQMMGVFAEFERAMIAERVRAGLRRAVSEGKTLGRPRLAADVEQRIDDSPISLGSYRRAVTMTLLGQRGLANPCRLCGVLSALRATECCCWSAARRKYTKSRSSRNQIVGSRSAQSLWPRCHRIYYAI